MLVVVSPAKNLDFETPIKVDDFTQPTMLQDTERLMEVCRTLSPADLSSLMKISDKLATLNANRFALSVANTLSNQLSFLPLSLLIMRVKPCTHSMVMYTQG